jgi:8-oxo-dGTP pyrophosphatase MutT (NUDIX family)
MLGGGLDHDEDPAACLKREIYEEAGLKVTHVLLNPSYFLTTAHHDGKYFVANIIYQVKLKNLEFIPSPECQELHFFYTEEMRQVQLFPNVKVFLILLEKQQTQLR